MDGDWEGNKTQRHDWMTSEQWGTRGAYVYGTRRMEERHETPMRVHVKYIISVSVYAAVVSLFIILYLHQKPCRLLWVLY